MRTVLLGMLIASCTSSPPSATATQATCPDPDPGTLTWDSFGQKFMADFCTSCHDSALPHAQRNGAPLYHDYNTLLGVMQIPEHIDSWAGAGPAADNTLMPPSRCPTTPGGPLDRSCPQPTEQQRMDLSVWLACEKNRPHTF
jgi:hypothetical protein